MPEAKHTNPQPRKTFEELARDLECDESEERFEEAVRKVAKSPPQHREKEDPSDRR
jgi:hypothetical protein